MLARTTTAALTERQACLDNGLSRTSHLYATRRADSVALRERVLTLVTLHARVFSAT